MRDVSVTLSRVLRAIVGEFLRDEDMTREKLAEMFGTDRTQIGRYINGERRLTLEHIEHFADQIGVVDFSLLVNKKAAKMPPDQVTPDEEYRGEGKLKPGRPPKGTSQVSAMGTGLVKAVPLSPRPSPKTPAGGADQVDGVEKPIRKQPHTRKPRP